MIVLATAGWTPRMLGHETDTSTRKTRVFDALPAASHGALLELIDCGFTSVETVNGMPPTFCVGSVFVPWYVSSVGKSIERNASICCETRFAATLRFLLLR